MKIEQAVFIRRQGFSTMITDDDVKEANAVLADAYLALHGEDDGELVTAEWLESQGFQPHHCSESDLISGDGTIICNLWGMEFTVCNARPRIKTRGQLRHLIRGLGGKA